MTTAVQDTMIRYDVATVQHSLTLGGLGLGAAAVVAAQAGVEWAAETFVVKHGEGAEADARLVVKLAAVLDVAAAHLTIRLLTGETRVNAWENRNRKRIMRMITVRSKRPVIIMRILLSCLIQTYIIIY